MHWSRLYDIVFSLGFIFQKVIQSTSINYNPYNSSAQVPDYSVQIKQNSYNSPTSNPLLTSVKLKDHNVCVINIKMLTHDHALIIDASDHMNFIYPDSQGHIVLEQNRVIFLTCPGQNNSLKNIPGLYSSSNITCIRSRAFAAHNEVYDFNDLTCKLPPKYEIIDKGFYGRESEYRKFEIGFYTDESNRFLKIIDIYYDRSTMSTMYAKSVVSRFIAGKQKSAKLHRYDQTHCCERQRNRLDMDTIYSAKTQDRSFAAQLYCHDSEFRTRCSYLSALSATVFNCGQLSPKSSFVYTAASSASFIYLNTGPQWRPVRDGNWARIEDHIVEMAKGLRQNLVVYTGVYDRLRLKDTGDSNRKKMMFLYAGANNDRSIAIPLYFWKLVYEPTTKRGVVFVTVNNPYMERGEEYHACEKPIFTKQGMQMPKLWKPTSIAKGYSYVCEVPDFLKSNGITFEDFSASMVTGLLYLERKIGNETTTSKTTEES